jgi:hypothetical protein
MSISKILKGIDQHEICDDDGWWETSSGAAFGRLKLVEAQGYEFGLLSRIEAYEQERKEMNHIEQKQLAAGKTLEQLGYTWQGGELWKPPLGANPEPLLARIDQLQAEVGALRKDAEWIPIETAPKGEVLLGFVPHSMGGYICPIDRNTVGEWINTSCIDLSTVKPTYWKPALYPPFNSVIAGEAT